LGKRITNKLGYLILHAIQYWSVTWKMSLRTEIAADLGISEITAKVHRLHTMRKMRARSLADLVRIADALGIHRDKPGRL